MTKSPDRFPGKLAGAVATVAVALLLWHGFVGRPAGLDPRSVAGVARLPVFEKAAPVPAVATQPESKAAGSGPVAGTPSQSTSAAGDNSSALLIDPGDALGPFFAALAVTGGTTTVMHFGDSPTTADLITGDVRVALQQRFGDAGAGFNLPAKPWAWYQHRDIDARDHGWKWTTAVGYMRPVAAGIGGAAFDGGEEAWTHFEFAGAEPASVEVAYAAQADGGSFMVSANDQAIATIDTGLGKVEGPTQAVALAEPGLRFQSMALPKATRTLDVRVTAGTVRLYGVSFLSGKPGLMYDSLGLNGASITVLSRAILEDTLKASFEHMHPDLIVINYGTNEAGFNSWIDSPKGYEAELRMAIARVKAAAPGAAILVMSPMDRGERGDGGEVRTMASIPKIVAIQQRVAAETGCAFFNTYQAMGGERTMQRWYEAKHRLVGGDLIHPTPQGAKMVADVFTGELLGAYERYRGRAGR